MSATLTGGMGLKVPSIVDTVKQLVDDLSHNFNKLDKIYPVGSIYMSTAATNPSEFLGGSWERINGRFLVGIDNSTFKPGVTGGRFDMGIHRNRDESGAANDAKNGGLVLNNTTSHCVGFGGRVIVSEDNYTGKLIPPYYPVYIWHRVA